VIVHKSARIALLVIVFVLSSFSVVSLDKVIANSASWSDVYSAMMYATEIGKQPGLFLTSPNHGTILLYSIPKDANGTLIVSSRSQSYIPNYRAVMQSQGYTNVEEITSNTINIDLAKRLVKEKNIRKFIVVDDAYGYNALSAASYAILDNFYVIFANDRNIGTVDSFLSSTNPTKIIIFGQVDEVVKTRLAKYNPETINLGDRFDNNIEMVKRYQAIKHAKQTLMSNGEFIESSIMSGQDPVLFIGKSTVPDQVKAYVKESEFQVAVLVGNELVNSATTIRRDLGISVFVKFAQGARTPSGAVATVEDLDKFPMPKYSLNLELYSILYNKATNALWVTYHNKAGIGTYLLGTINLGSSNKIGDPEPVFIDKNQYKTIIYDNVKLESEENVTAGVYTLFGEGKKSMENILQGTVPVQTVEILDSTLINITDIYYDKTKKAFIVTIQNIGDADTYVSLEMIDVFINGEYITISTPETKLLPIGKKAKFPVEVVLSDADVENNPVVKVKAYYGERENSLIKTLYGEYALRLVTIDYVMYALILAVVILIALIMFGRKKCPNCGTMNSRTRKKCKKCGHNL
jgi:archaellum component FlaF (FlaF/FlaG flagellin family)